MPSGLPTQGGAASVESGFAQAVKDVLPLLEGVNDAVLGVSANGVVAYANRAAGELFGLQPAQLRHMGLGRLLPSFKSEPLPPAGQGRDTVALRPDTTLLPVRLRVAQGQPGQEQWRWVILNNDRQRQGKGLGRHDVDFISAVLDFSGALLVVLDAGSQVVYFNQTCQELTGYSLQDVAGRHILEVLQDPGDAQVLREGLKALDEGEVLTRFESNWVIKSGESRRITWTNARVNDADGSINYFICTGIDITERQRTEATLRFTQFAVEKAEEAIFWVDEEGQFQYVNEAACRALSFDKEALLGRRLQDVAAHIPLGRWQSLWRLVKEKGAFTFEGVLRDSHGKEFPVEVLANHLAVQGREYVCAFARDLTERKRAEAALRESEKKYRKLAEAAGDAMLVVDAETGVVVDANRRAEVLFGLGREELMGQLLGDLTPPESQEAPRLLEDARRRGQAPAEALELLVRHKNGGTVPVEVSASVVELGGRRLVHGMFRDITARLKAEQALRQSRERYALATRATFDGIFDWDIPGGEMFYSSRWKAMLGYADEEIAPVPQEWLRRVHPHDKARVEAALTDHMEGRKPTFENEHRLEHRDGSHRWVLCRGLAERDEFGSPVRMAGFLTDITERKRQEEQMQRDAMKDGLTGLASWTGFTDRLGQALFRSKRSGGNFFAVLFLDIDNFRLLNDSYGFKRGDEVMKIMARRLVDCVSKDDTVGRFSGDEFTVLLEGESVLNKKDVMDVVGRIQLCLSEPISLSEHDGEDEVFLTASIGVALSHRKYDRPEEIIRDADVAMYWAKTQGPGRVAVFEDQMSSKPSADTVRLRSDLRRALGKNELLLHYQPIVALNTGKVAGLEALVRWQHPKRGLVPPGAFIPVAEQTHLIHELGQWVLEAACRQVAVWRRELNQPDLFVTVNLSAAQFKDPLLMGRVEGALAASGLPPSALKLELTESVVIENIEIAEEKLQEFKDKHIQLCLDDFGTGYSSLSYLQRFPMDILKIDRSFMKDLGRGAEDRSITEGVILLARNLEKGVVAEGVEEAWQANRLVELQCPYAQGYFFSRPLDAEAVTVLLGEKRGCLKEGLNLDRLQI